MLEMMSLGKKIVIGKDYNALLKIAGKLPAAPVRPYSSKGYFWALPDGTSGVMYGSSYGMNFTRDSFLTSAVRHAFPNVDLYNYAVQNRKYVIIKLLELGTQSSFAAVNRNGYTSKSWGSFGASQINDFIYYDNTTDKMMRYTPSTASALKEWDGRLI